MKRNLIRSIAAAAGLLVGVYALAQEPPVPPQGGPQGGPQAGFQGGGPQGSPPPMGGMRQGPPMVGPMILLRPEIREELKLTDEQIKKIRDAFHLPDRMGDGPPQGGPGFGGPGGQRGQDSQRGQGGPGAGFGGPEGPGGPGRAEGPEGGPRMRPEEADKKLKGILDDRQFARYREISLQMMGPGAVIRPDVAKELGLSEDQIDQIRGILELNRPPRPEGMGQDGPPPPGEGGQGGPGGQGSPGRRGPGGPGGPGGFGGGEEGRPPMPPAQGGFGQGGPGQRGPGQRGPGGPNDEMRKKVEAQVMAVLTEAQQNKWKKMLGKPFQPRPPRDR